MCKVNIIKIVFNHSYKYGYGSKKNLNLYENVLDQYNCSRTFLFKIIMK